MNRIRSSSIDIGKWKRKERDESNLKISKRLFGRKTSTPAKRDEKETLGSAVDERTVGFEFEFESRRERAGTVCGEGWMNER